MSAFKVGDHVKRRHGSKYSFPGVVVSVFPTRAGDIRYVVEAIGPNYGGLLHIFSDDQLVDATAYRPFGTALEAEDPARAGS